MGLKRIKGANGEVYFVNAKTGARVKTKMDINVKPETIESLPKSISKKRSLKEILFSFSGRMSRSDYWTRAFPIFFVYSIIVNSIFYIESESSELPIVSFILSLPSIWPALAVIIKRLHDRDRSGWFFCTLFIPLANAVFAIWIIIEVWFLKGTDGENRFGPDPVIY